MVVVRVASGRCFIHLFIKNGLAVAGVGGGVVEERGVAGGFLFGFGLGLRGAVGRRGHAAVVGDGTASVPQRHTLGIGAAGIGATHDDALDHHGQHEGDGDARDDEQAADVATVLSRGGGGTRGGGALLHSARGGMHGGLHGMLRAQCLRHVGEQDDACRPGRDDLTTRGAQRARRGEDGTTLPAAQVGWAGGAGQGAAAGA